MAYSNTQNSLEAQVIKMDNILVKKSTKFNSSQQKLFYICLASINNGVNIDNEIEINKEELFNYLGLNDSNRHTRIRKQFKNLLKASFIEFGNDENFNDGFLLVNTRSTRKKIYVEIGRRYKPLLIELSKNYTKLLNDDVTLFNSKYSMMLYQNLMRLNVYSNHIEFTTQQLKDFFGLKEADYVYNGAFNRALFERKTINVAVKEINEKSKCIKNLVVSKEYSGRKVACYVFSFKYFDPQQEKNTRYEKEPLENKDRLEDYKNFNWWEV